ncbi:MAG: hypothetical protein LBM76_02825 [Mycoplasmataceae bacterium]|nr:hypothetical protein [Mycoplasmataceae bacterium]
MKTYILLFGITGDLSKRMLLPSIEFLLKANKIKVEHLYGVSRRDIDINEILELSLGNEAKESILKNKISSIKLSDKLADYISFKESIKLDSNSQLLIYLSVPPTSACDYVEWLGKAGLNTKNVKLLLEKPFGTDYESASTFLESIDKYYKEDQVYKVDHYLAKKNAQLLIEFRKHMKTKYDLKNIKEITVAASETIDIQGRGIFYEQTGALRDFIQGHLLELLLLVICNIPVKASDIVNKRVLAVKKLSLVPTECFRAQYESYKDEVQNANTVVETFASIALADSRHPHIKINLVTGKALEKKETYIEISFKDKTTDKIFITPDVVFPHNFKPSSSPLDGYKAVFLGAINNNKTIFTSSKEILASWKIFDPLLALWTKDKSITNYTQGANMLTILTKVKL